jgi:hypothetical protein
VSELLKNKPYKDVKKRYQYQIHFMMLGYWLFIVAGTYSVTHVRNSEIKQLRPLIFAIKLVTTKYLAKFQSSRAITRPKIIGPEQIVHLICNSSLYTHIPNIKSISQSIAKISGRNCFISELRTWVTLYVPATINSQYLLV